MNAMRMKSVGSVTLLSVMCGTNLPMTEVHAQEAGAEAMALEEVVVSAQRRKQRLQDVPISVSAVTGGLLERIGAEELQDYFAFVPGVNLASVTLGERGGQNIIIRGVSNARLVGTDASSLSSTTGFYLNDIPVTPVDVQLFDTARIEVLRGPQGTLYGAASMGGAVKLYMNEPDSESFQSAAEAKVETIKDGGQGYSVSGMLNVPIVEGTLAARFVAQQREQDGYIDTMLVPLSNTTPNSGYPALSGLDLDLADKSGQLLKDTNSSRSSGARLALRYTPNERLTIEPAVLWQRAESDDQSSLNGNYGTIRLNEKATLEPVSSEMVLSSLNISYDFGPVTLTSESGHYTRHYEENLDRSLNTFRVRGGAAMLGTIPAVAYGVNVIDWETYTQEVRLQSNNSGSSGSWYERLNWVIGGFVMDEARDGSQYVQAPGWAAARPLRPLPMANDFLFANTWVNKDENTAFFADATFALTDHLTVAAGVRYFDQSTRQVRPLMDAASPVVARISEYAYKETGTSPRYNVSYRLGDNHLIYVAAAEGFRLGGGTIPLNFTANPECQPVVEGNNLQQFASGEFDSDSVWNYEGGLKSTFADGRLTVNVVGYQLKWTDLQQQISLAAFPGSLCNRALTANVGEAESEGVELELSAAPTENLLLQGSASIGKSRITDPGAGVTTVKKGTPMQSVPDETYSFAANYSIPLTIRESWRAFIRADARYIGATNAVTASPITNPRLQMDSYTMLGLRFGIELDRFTVTLYGENLLDEIPQLNAFVRPGVPEIVNVTTAQPRTIGISLRMTY